MRRMLAVATVAGLVAAGCATGASADCAAIADDAIVLLQDFVDQVDAMNRSADPGAVLDAAFIGQLEDQAADLDDRSAAAGCSEALMVDLLSERSDQLTASTEGGEAMIDVIVNDQFFTP